MTARSRGVRVGSALPSWGRHPVAVPVAVALLAVVLLASVGWVAVHNATNTVQSDAQTRVRSSRDAAVRAVERQSNDLKADVAAWALNDVLIHALAAPTPAGLSDAQNHLSTMVRSNQSPAAFISDTRGLIIATYPAQPGVLGKDFSYRDWFQGASRTGRPYVSAAYRTAATRHPLVVGVASPVLEGSRRVGYITLLWQLNSIRSVSEGARRDDAVTITVTDQHGQPLTGTPSVDLRGQPLSVVVPATTRQALAGRSVSTAGDGQLQAVGPVPGSGWTVTASQPSSVALAPASAFQRSQRRTVGVALLLVLLFTALAWRLARSRAAENRRSEDRFRRVFHEGLSGKLLANRQGHIVLANTAMARVLIGDPPELIGRPLAEIFADESDQLRIREFVRVGDGELLAEMTLRDADNKPLLVSVSLSWMSERYDEREILAQVDDITAQRAAEQQLTQFALHDELTGLPNRRLLLERCEHAIVRARSGRSASTSLACLFIDLDGFKPINDAAGHDAGDQVLIAVARDLSATLRPTETLARVGGDEFVVLLQEDVGLSQLRGVADRVITTIRRHVTSEEDSLVLSASVGIARVDLADEPEMTPDRLLRRADAAMYSAKERGRDRYDIFDTDLRDRTEAKETLVRTMREGLRDDRVALVFQPVVDVDSNIVVGAEALMRLRNAEGLLQPTLSAVIAAEGAGLAEVLGDRVLHLALGAAQTWPRHMSLAVNISALELTGPNLRRRVEHALQRHDFDPARLILEITESSILRAGPAALVELEKLRQSGVRVAIDDFGTAYATLQNLTILPVDALKVDTSFTAGLPHRRAHTAIVHGIASMAFELDIPCIIEGVETETQLAAIRGMSVHAQGWLWGQPQGPECIPMLHPVPQPAPAHPEATRSVNGPAR